MKWKDWCSCDVNIIIQVVYSFQLQQCLPVTHTCVHSTYTHTCISSEGVVPIIYISFPLLTTDEVGVGLALHVTTPLMYLDQH